jgi:hypothetical protein
MRLVRKHPPAKPHLSKLEILHMLSFLAYGEVFSLVTPEGLYHTYMTITCPDCPGPDMTRYVRVTDVKMQAYSAESISTPDMFVRLITHSDATLTI